MESPRVTLYGDRRAMVRQPFGSVYQLVHLLPAEPSHQPVAAMLALEVRSSRLRRLALAGGDR